MTLDSTVSIENVTPELISDLIAFGATYFPAGNINLSPDYLNWLCLKNPHGRARAVLIREDRELIGQMLLIPVRLTSGETSGISSYYAVNALTHPERRNLRLFSRMILATKDFATTRHEWLLGHPNAAAINAWKRQGMQFCAPLLPSLGTACFPQAGTKNTLIGDYPSFSRIAEDVLNVAAASNDGTVTILRDAEYFRWRFFDHPARLYKFYVAKSKGRIFGYYVARSWKYCLDLAVDIAILPDTDVPLRFNRPTVVMTPQRTNNPKARKMCSVALPTRKIMPYFATTFDDKSRDFSGISLAASDF